jgi:predicted nucleic acid-binding protein
VFLDEEGSSTIASLVADGPLSATSPLGYVECRAVFARLAREGHLTPRQLVEIVQTLDERWNDLIAVELADAVRREAGSLADEYGLRGAGAVHLASARTFAESARAPVVFACFDRRLWRAANAAGFEMAPETEP